MEKLYSKTQYSINFDTAMLSAQLYPVLQAVWDLFSGEILGFEVLIRSIDDQYSTEDLFDIARESGSLWNLEYICREKILRVLSRLVNEYKNKLFFINIDHSVMSENLFKLGFSRSLLSRYGLSMRNIVIEISEKASYQDYEHFEKIMKIFKQEGLQIAIDDFGLGRCSMKTLVKNPPHYIKIDHHMITGLDQSSEKQNFLKSLLSLTHTQNIQIIAEGVEKWEELKILFNKGLRYAQGYLIGMPVKHPPYINPENQKKLKEIVSNYHKKQFSLDLSIASTINLPQNYQFNEITCSELDNFFRFNQNQDHVVLLNKRCPKGIITKQHFYSQLKSPHGYSFYKDRYIDEIAITDILCVDESRNLRYVSKLALARNHHTVYDPVIVVNQQNDISGTITIHQLMDRAFDIQVKMAIDANPLTQLPGNKMIEQWLETLLQQKAYSVIYADLDSFKEYNDTYGFASGDRMLKLLSRILKKYAGKWKQTIRVGHIGGDDFIIMVEGIVNHEFPQAICQEFDIQKKDLFNFIDWDQGFYYTTSRKGEKIKANLATLSLSIVTSQNFLKIPHPRQLSQNVSLLKKKIKAINLQTRKSGYIYDQRNNL